jgi:hypothetical protein
VRTIMRCRLTFRQPRFEIDWLMHLAGRTLATVS